MGFETRRNKNGYFSIIKSNKSKISLNEIIKDINLNDFNIYKKSTLQREVSVAEFLDFKFSGYIFFDKKIYDKNNINEWIEFLKEKKIHIIFLSKQFPPNFFMKKIRIKK